MSQALLKFMDAQHVSLDGDERKFVRGVMGIFGHGNATGLGEALEFTDTKLPFLRANNEQGMVHAATAYAKRMNRLGIYACTSSIGPGATNMVTGAAAATINRIPVLLLPGDAFASRQPDPVLQQLEVLNDYNITCNDCFRPVSRYWDRIARPEQLMTALLNAFRVLTDPVETGAVTLSLPQDTQSEACDYPISFFHKRVWHIERRPPSGPSLERAVSLLLKAERPLVIAGGGVHYSLASDDLRKFAGKFQIPVAETQAGKSAMSWKDPMSVGGVGVTGTKAANILARQADLVLAIGTRMTDFTTISKQAFTKARILQINVSSFDGLKSDAALLQADAREALQALSGALEARNFRTPSAYSDEIARLRDEWKAETDRLYALERPEGNSQTAVLGRVNRFLRPDDVIVSAAGSLPGDLHRLWRCERPGSYHLEYGFSCMGYEVAGAFGVKLASPDSEVYAIVGDGSFLMLHSELLTSLQEGVKINVILLDNHGFQCIRGLQKSHGGAGLGNELRHRDSAGGGLTGDIVPVDFAGLARALGARTFFAENPAEFERALALAREETVSTLIHIRTLPDSMSGGYESWWRVGVAEVSRSPDVLAAHDEMKRNIQKARKY